MPRTTRPQGITDTRRPCHADSRYDASRSPVENPNVPLQHRRHFAPYGLHAASQSSVSQVRPPRLSRVWFRQTALLLRRLMHAAGQRREVARASRTRKAAARESLANRGLASPAQGCSYRLPGRPYTLSAIQISPTSTRVLSPIPYVKLADHTLLTSDQARRVVQALGDDGDATKRVRDTEGDYGGQ